MINKRAKKRLMDIYNTYSNEFQVLDRVLNEFGENEGLQVIGTIRGIFYKNGNIMIKKNTDEAGSIVSDKNYSVTALINEETSRVIKGMYLMVNGEKFEIIDRDNENGLNFDYIYTLKKASDSND